MNHSIRLSILLAAVTAASAANAAAVSANPYYISPRSGVQHIPLADDWDLSWRDAQIASTAELASQPKWIRVARPTSVQMALYHAGELPYPYYNLNSQKYRWVTDKMWYYRKVFEVSPIAAGSFAILRFEGVNYFARVLAERGSSGQP